MKSPIYEKDFLLWSEQQAVEEVTEFRAHAETKLDGPYTLDNVLDYDFFPTLNA